MSINQNRDDPQCVTKESSL